MTRRRKKSGRTTKDKPEKLNKRRMLMNVVDPEEVRVAITGAGGLEELYIERGGSSYVHGNIYKGRVVNVEPTLQAAFVDIGGERNGFLHVSDIIPPTGGYDDILKKKRRKKLTDSQRPSIEQMLHKGQELLVQITRESLETKGPSLTTYVSLPGRYLVLMPAVSKRGVSRKIRDEKERTELKRELDAIDPPKDLGFIIRTAGMGRGKKALKNDLKYLTRLWDAIKSRAKKVKAPDSIYRESDLGIRAIRDYLYEDVEELLIDSSDEFKRAKEFLGTVMPDFADKAIAYEESEPLFHAYGVEEEIEKIFSRNVALPSGGSIVIEQTEALVAIDVNTGRFRKGDSTQDTIFAINMEAAEAVARQIRLRDLGGLIMIDFIDMESQAERRKVEAAFRKASEGDRARSTILPIGRLGVMEMSRQRVRKSLKRTHYAVCESCGGTGLHKSIEVLAVEFVRRLRIMLDSRSGILEVRMHPEVALGIANQKRAAISALETQKQSRITIFSDPSLRIDEMVFSWGITEGE